MENNKNSHLEVMRAEVPGPVFGKVVSRIKGHCTNSLFAVFSTFCYFCSDLLSGRNAFI